MNDGKVAWIVGASSGIGLAVAREFAGSGWRVGLGARRADLLSEIAASLPGTGHVAVPLDVSTGDSVRSWAESLRNRLAEPDLVVYSAGWGVFRKVVDTTEEEWDRTVDVNLKGLFLVAREVLPAMTARRSGHIVSILSVVSRVAFPKNGAYAASKFGALGLTEVLRMEARRHGVRVTSVIPGATDTPFWDHLEGDWDRSKMMPASSVARAIRTATEAGPESMVEEIRIAPQLGNL